MILGPRYKICKRLGSSIFEKCQTQAFALSKQRSDANKKKGRRNVSDYNRQLIEKQKLRLLYGLTEKQFSTYVEKALESKANPQSTLFSFLESRLDSIVYRMGLASTHRMARQMVSHGHICVNGTRVTIPSYRVSPGDAITVRVGSRESGLFQTLADKLKEARTPSWISFDVGTLEGKLQTAPVFSDQDTAVDIGAVFEYYTR
ncbi:MAG: 30S ribosomal protein S4 [Patescibacteria group bacterium]